MSTIDTLLKEIKMLKPMPAIANRILSSIENPQSSMADIAEIVMHDPSTTANLLKICNSAYFGIARKIDSVKDAVSLLGIDQVVDIILLNGGARNLTQNQNGYGLHEGDLWRQAVASALVAQELAEKRDVGQQKHMIFTAALLKDIGKVILDRYVESAFDKVMDQIESSGLSFREAEKKVFGIDHAELGGLIAKSWKFSPKMVTMITNHHLPNESAYQDTGTAIVYLADIICMMMGIGGGADGLAYRFHDKVLQNMNITPADLQEIILQFGEKMEQIETLVQMA